MYKVKLASCISRRLIFLKTPYIRIGNGYFLNRTGQPPTQQMAHVKLTILAITVVIGFLYGPVQVSCQGVPGLVPGLGLGGGIGGLRGGFGRPRFGQPRIGRPIRVPEGGTLVPVPIPRPIPVPVRGRLRAGRRRIVLVNGRGGGGPVGNVGGIASLLPALLLPLIFITLIGRLTTTAATTTPPATTT